MAIKAGCSGSMDGICCRMVIETKRVFDGCAFTDDNITLTLTTDAPIPQGAEFVSARVIGSEMDGYSIGNSGGECSRVVGDVVTRFAVTYSIGGQLASVGASYRESKDVLLKIPSSNSAVPFRIEVRSNMVVGGGAVIGPNTVSVFGCLLQIIKVTALVDILIPTYGYCKYPPCTGCSCPGTVGNIFPELDDE